MADDIVSQYYLANALRQGQRQSTRSLLAQRMMGNALDTSPTTPLGALARALTGVVSAYTMRQAEEGDRLDQKQALASLMDRDQQQQDEAAQWSARMNGQGAQPPAGGAAPAPAPVMREALPGIGAPAPQGAPAGAFSPVAMRSLVGQESAGDPNARPIDRQTGQPRSSALGQAQFIAPTWLAFAGANPNLFHGLDLNTPAGRNAALARRTDPALTEPAVQWYAGQNAQALQQAGLPVTDASLAAAHALGPAGAIGVLRAAPDTPLSRVLSPAAIQANPQYGRMTAGQFVSDYGARYAPRGSVVQFAGPGAPTGPAAGTVEGSAPGDVQAALEALRQGQGAPGAAAAGGGALPPSAPAAAAPAAPAVNMQALQEGLGSRNPEIRRRAEAQIQALQLQRQTEAERRAEAAAARQEERDRQAMAEQARQQARQEERDRLAQEAAARAEVRANQGPIPQGMRMNPQTQQLEPIPGFTPPSSQPTEQERISAGYASRMMAAEQTLSRVVRGGFNPGNWTDATMGRLPIVGNALTSEGGQLYRQAQEDWVRAKLRRESGAVIGAEEMAQEIRTYFPQPGDTPAMIAQKEQARLLASQAMVGAAGRGTIITPPETPAAPPAGAGNRPPLSSFQR